MVRKVSTFLLAVIVGTGTLLAGCGKQSDQAASQSTPATQTQKEVAGNLRMLYPGTSEAEKQWAVKLQDTVKAKYPKLNIEYMFLNWTDLEQKLSVMNSSGDSPDLTETQDVTNMVAMKALEPLDSYITNKESLIKLDQFPKAVLDYSKIDGKIYSAPLLGVAYGLAVNKTILAKVGMKPEDLKTWDDFKKAAQAMTKDGKYGYAVAAGAARFAFRDGLISGLSDDVTPNDTSDASKKKYIEVLNLYKDLTPYMPVKTQVTWQYPELFKAYCNGDVGMIATGTYFTANVYGINPDIIKDTVMIPFPKGPSASTPKAMVANAGIAMISGGKQKEAAWKVMETAISEDMVADLAGAVNMPGSKGIDKTKLSKSAEKAYPKAFEAHVGIINDFSKIADQYGTPQPQIIGQPQMEPVFQEAFVKLTIDKASVDDVYNTIKTGIDKTVGKK